MKLKAFYLLFILFSTLEAGAVYLNPYLESDQEQHSRILNSRTNYLKPDQSPSASVGVILYTYHKSEPYLLIAEEASHKKGAGTFCELGGSVELVSSSRQPETFMEALRREAKEESAYKYDLEAEDLKKSLLYHNVNPGNPPREEVYAFVKPSECYPVADLEKAVQQATAKESKEKERFLWVKSSCFHKDNLPKSESTPMTVIDSEGKIHLIRLRNYFLKTMQSDDIQEILKAIEGKGKSDSYS